MIFLCHLIQIKAFILFQEFRKIFVIYWILKLIYPQHFTQKQINKILLLIKRCKYIFALLLIINKIIGQKN